MAESAIMGPPMPSPFGHSLAGLAVAWAADLLPGERAWRVAPATASWYRRAGNGLTVTCAVDFTTRSAASSAFRLDFAREGVLTCDSGFTGCTIDGSKLEAALSGSSETFPCEVVDGP